MFIRCLPVLCLASLGAARLAQRGWLDRLVEHHRKNFIEELSRLPSPLTVTVEKAPPGFVDSPKWDKESVLRLVMLVEVLDARPVRHAIRRALSPSRRSYLPPGKNSFDIFPSWSQDHPNDFEYDDMVSYDDSSSPPAAEPTALTEDTVIYISNPVEAHLPSARVTVRLLRDIMEVRAAGLRAMPTTTRPTRSWKSKSSTSAAVSEAPAGSTATDSTIAADDTTAADGAMTANSTAAAVDTTGDASGSPGEANGTKQETASVASDSPAPT